MIESDSTWIKAWLIAILLLNCMAGEAQPIRYSDFYDSNQGAEILKEAVIRNDGSLLVIGATGNSNGSGYINMFNLVVNDQGDMEQSHVIEYADGHLNSKAVLRSIVGEAIYVAGYICDYSIPSPGYCDFYLAKLGQIGDTLFTKVYEQPDTSDYLLDIVQTRPNKLMLIGWTYDDTTNADADLMFITVDTVGNEVNRVVWGGSGTDYVHSGTVINEMGDVFMTGYTASFQGGDNDSWVVKTDSIGNVLWHRTYNHLSPSDGDGGSVVCKFLGDDFIVIGASANSATGDSDGYIMRITDVGDVVWTKKYVPEDGSQGFWAGWVDENGFILACGQTTNTDDDSQAGWLVKTDANGDTLWTRTYNPSGLIDRLLNMLVMPNGDIVMVGSGRDTGQTNQDGWILRVDSMGCVVENCHITGVNDELEIRDEKLRVWPNPTSSIIYIESTERLNDLTLFDLRGKMLLSATDNSIDLSVLPDGMYLLQARDVKGNSYTQKVMKR